MYNDKIIIKKRLEIDLLNKFGESVKNIVFSLEEKLAGKDTFVDSYLLINLQNILSLEKSEAEYVANLALELSSASAFAPVLLLEKIPTLCFYGLTAEIGSFLSNIKNYGARAVSLFLGSDQLKTDDLMDVLERSTVSFYRALLEQVNKRHQEFVVCCAIIMRAAAKLEAVIRKEEITAYLDICTKLINKYGSKIAEQYITNTKDFIKHIPLDKNLSTIEAWATKSQGAAEFVVTHPDIVFSSSLSEGTLESTREVKLAILRSNDYQAVLSNPLLFEDLEFAALVIAWPTLSKQIKSNILFQLSHDNYKKYMMTHGGIKQERDVVNHATGSKWLAPWTFCEEVVDLTFIRKRIGNLLQENGKFNLEAKSIINQNKQVFDRSNVEYSNGRVSTMIDILLSYCNDALVHKELSSMASFVKGIRDPLKDLLSYGTLVVQAWDRDPWKDYGKSDELYSCTGLGDYNAANAPGFLADLNINNLDIWSNGKKVGRVHLCLVNDELKQPTLLLDCVDGTDRMLVSKKKYELIMSAILAYARWLGVNKIKVNYDIDFNTTPKKFIASLEREYHEQNRIDFVSRLLPVNTSKWLIPYPCQTFLESFVKNNGGFVRGVVIKL